MKNNFVLDVKSLFVYVSSMDLHATKNVSAAQLRAARGLLDCSIEEIASISGMSREALSKIERGHSRPQRATMSGLITTFEARGIIFTDDDGVRKRNDMFRLLEGENPYLDLLDDMFHTMKSTRGEILFFCIDNSLSPQIVIDSDLRMRHDGVRFRSLIDEENPYCLYPLSEYRCIPHVHYKNNPMAVYADKVGVLIDIGISQNEPKSACILTRNASYANAMRRIFEALWLSHKMPSHTIAKVTYA